MSDEQPKVESPEPKNGLGPTEGGSDPVAQTVPMQALAPVAASLTSDPAASGLASEAPTFPAGPDSPVWPDSVPAAWSPPPRRSHKGRWFGLVGVVILLLLLAFSVVVKYRNDHTVVAEAATTEQGTTHVHSSGVSLNLPNGWRNIPTTPAEFQEYLDTAAGLSPELKKTIEEVQAGGQIKGLSMLAVSPVVAGRHCTATLTVEPGHASLGEAMASLSGVLASLHAVNPQSFAIKVGGLDAVELHYVLIVNKQTLAKVYTAQTIVLGDKSLAIVTVSTGNDDPAAELHAIAPSIRFD